MGIYNIDYSNVILNLLPPQYRLRKFNEWLNSLIHPIQTARDNFFDRYIYSSTYTFYDGVSSLLIPYAYTKVKFLDNTVWEAQIDNIDCLTYNPTIGQITSGTTTLWLQIQDDFVGFDERVHYSNQKIMFEYLLNNYFKHDLSTNYIYITTFNIFSMVEIAQTDAEGGAVIAQTDDDSIFFISETSTENSLYNFTIYVPTLIATQLGINYDEIIRNIADRYNYLSLSYNIVVY